MAGRNRTERHGTQAELPYSDETSAWHHRLQNAGTARYCSREVQKGDNTSMKIIMPAGLQENEPITIPNLVKIKVACYIRVSTDDPTQEDSYEAQEKYFTKLLFSRPDWDSVGVYSDYGISGTNKEKRTGLNRLLRHCEQGKIDRVICKSISRLSRNSADTVAIIRRLKELGITCYFEKESLDTADMKSEFILTTLAALAQEESRTISENLRWSFDRRAPKGDLPNYRCYGYKLTDEIEVTSTGYKRRKIEIIPEEAEVVKAVFLHYVEGLSMTDIAHILNHKKIPAPWSDCGWTIGRIGYILRNERYCGDVLTHKHYTEDYLTHKSKRNLGEVSQYYIQDHHPAIITRELYQTAQLRISAAKLGTARNNYPFTSRLVCAHCGKKYHVRKNGHSKLWICSGAILNNGVRICEAQSISQIMLDLMFLNAVETRFSGISELIAHLEATQDIDFMERDRSILRRQLAIIEDEIDDAKKSYEELCSQLDVLKMRQEMFGKDFDEAEIAEEIKIQTSNMEQLEVEKSEIQAVIDSKEQHLALLEKDYAIREELIAFLKTADKKTLRSNLPKYVKALALSIDVHDKTHFTVHWFDETETEIFL